VAARIEPPYHEVVRLLWFLLLAMLVRADTSAPEKAPACHGSSWRDIERAFTI
jgi:hypothetical protein